MMIRQRQLGVGLVELMLAILISSFLLIGVTEIFSSNKRTYNYQQVQGMANENQRIASVLLTNVLHQIGYLPITVESMTGKSEVFLATNGFVAGETLKGVGSDSAGEQKDQITYRYFSGDGVVTCAGQDFNLVTVGDDQLQFRERTETLSIDENGHLICTGITINGSDAPVTETVVLMGDTFVDAFQRIEVKEMSISYGIDADNDESVDTYAKAGAVDAIEITNSIESGFGSVADTPWQRVRLLKVELVVQSGLRPEETSEYIVFLENLSEMQQ